MIITMLYAGLLGLLFFYMSVKVIKLRIRNQISIGDNGNQTLAYAVRAHANFAEYVPITLVLLAFLENTGTSIYALHAIGIMLLVGRLLHAYSFLGSHGVRPRQMGMVLTFIALLLSSLGCILTGLSGL